MSEPNTRLTRDLIGDTSLWRLFLSIGPDRLDALLIGPESVEQSVRSHFEPLTDSSLTALENAVYDNPLLLSDFAAVNIAIDSPEFFICPEGLGELHEEMAETMLPDYCAPRKLVASALPDGSQLVCAIDAERLNFLRRSFAQAQFTHALATEATYLAHRNRAAGDSAHTFAICADGRMSLQVFDKHGSLVLTNVYPVQCADDCAYFILAASGKSDGPVSVGGDPSLRNDVCARLRTAAPDARILPMTLPEHLLRLRSLAPALPDYLLFLTQL